MKLILYTILCCGFFIALDVLLFSEAQPYILIVFFVGGGGGEGQRQ